MHRLPRAATTTEWQEWRSRVQRSYSHGSSQGDVEQDAELCEAIERARRQVERVHVLHDPPELHAAVGEDEDETLESAFGWYVVFRLDAFTEANRIRQLKTAGKIESTNNTSGI